MARRSTFGKPLAVVGAILSVLALILSMIMIGDLVVHLVNAS